MRSTIRGLGTSIVAAAFSLSVTARAVQWSGGGVTSNWTNANNWISFDRPNNDGSDWVTFYGNTARDTSTVNQDYWIQGIYFGTSLGDSTSNTIESSNGAILTMDHGVINEVSDAQTFGVAIKANSNITFDNGGTGSTYGLLTFNSQLDTNGKVITFEPSFGNITVNGSIIGTGAINVRGSGTVQLNAANSFSGGLQIENGTLQFGGGSSLGSTSGFVYMQQAGTSNPPTLLRTGTGTVSIPVFLSFGECRLSASAGVTATYSRGLTGSTAARLVKTGAGTVVLAGSAQFSPGQEAPFGETSVNSGTLHLAANYALSGRQVAISSGATLSTAPGTLQVFGQFNGAGNLTLGTGTTVYVGNGAALNADGSGTFTGGISGADIIFRKEASGILSLQGNNSYSGTTLVMSGILSADNAATNSSATGSSNINVQPGGTLAGDGVVAGAVVLNAGATISPSYITTPGRGFGSLSTGPLTMESGSTMVIDFDPSQCDSISVTGNAVLGSRLVLSGWGAEPTAFNRRKVLSTTGTRTGIFTQIDGVSLSPSRSLAVTYGDDGVYLTVADPGDATLDGSVNFDDLLRLAQNYESSALTTWSLADFTGDAATNFDDLLILAQNYGQTFSADWALAQSMVPEPTAMLAAAATLPALLRRHR